MARRRLHRLLLLLLLLLAAAAAGAAPDGLLPFETLPVSEWTSEDVAAWALSHGLSAKAAQRLTAMGVDGALLPHLTDFDLLEEAMVVRAADRAHLLAQRDQLLRPEAPAPDFWSYRYEHSFFVAVVAVGSLLWPRATVVLAWWLWSADPVVDAVLGDRFPRWSLWTPLVFPWFWLTFVFVPPAWWLTAGWQLRHTNFWVAAAFMGYQSLVLHSAMSALALGRAFTFDFDRLMSAGKTTGIAFLVVCLVELLLPWFLCDLVVYILAAVGLAGMYFSARLPLLKLLDRYPRIMAWTNVAHYPSFALWLLLAWWHGGLSGMALWLLGALVVLFVGWELHGKYEEYQRVRFVLNVNISQEFFLGSSWQAITEKQSAGYNQVLRYKACLCSKSLQTVLQAPSAALQKYWLSRVALEVSHNAQLMHFLLERPGKGGWSSRLMGIVLAQALQLNLPLGLQLPDALLALITGGAIPDGTAAAWVEICEVIRGNKRLLAKARKAADLGALFRGRPFDPLVRVQRTRRRRRKKKVKKKKVKQ